VRDLDAAITRRLGLEIPPSIQGVIVTKVDPASAGFVPAVRRWFVIMEINRQPIRSAADYLRIVSAARSGDVLAFYGYDPSLGQRTFVTATVDESR
jgi:S1-C subfamily serine protease